MSAIRGTTDHLEARPFRLLCATFGLFRILAPNSTCPECAYRTLETTSTVLSAATKTSTGRKRIDYDCRNCSHSDSETRTIPKISESSSSGSSRSSFGGGSSSGGGASGSW